MLGGLPFGVVANVLSTPPGEYGARLKLKGIDGGPHKRWSMWFNSSNAQNLTSP